MFNKKIIKIKLNKKYIYIFLHFTSSGGKFVLSPGGNCPKTSRGN